MKGSSRKLLLPGAALLALTLLTAGCGSGGTQIRYLNAIPGAGNVDFWVDSTEILTSSAYGSTAKYQGIGSGSHTVEVRTAGTATDLINTSVTLQGGKQYTFLAEKVQGNNAPVLLTDDNTAPASGDIKIRGINASPTCPVDIYVVPHGTSISGFRPTWPNIVQPNATSNPIYLSISAGTYDIIGTFPATQLAIAEVLNQTMAEGQIRSIVFLDAPTGGPPCSASLVLPDLN
jgi:hypothetical protein